jgi:hypothetical protein
VSLVDGDKRLLFFPLNQQSHCLNTTPHTLYTFPYSWFVWQFEKAMQQHIGKCIYIPYYDWERDAEREWEGHVWHEETFGRWGATTSMDGKNCVDEGIASVHDTDFQWSLGIDNGPEGCLERNFMSGFSYEGEAQILAMIANFEQFANTAENGVNGFRIEYEVGPHNMVHGIIGGHMETNWSGADPIFWLHHSNIDRHWTMWQDYWDHDDCDTVEYVDPWHFEGDLDSQLPYSGSGASWNFEIEYEDGSRDYPTVRDVMSNHGPYMHVTYMNDHLAYLLDYDPNPRLFQLAEDDVDVRCDRDNWRNRKLNRDIDEIEGVTAKNSLRGDVIQNIFKEGVDDERPTSCRNNALFTLEEDREQWKQLCMDLPYDTPMAERLALLAENNCNRRGNPRIDVSEFMSRMKMEMNGPMEAFECFHRPDRK